MRFGRCPIENTPVSMLAIVSINSLFTTDFFSCEKRRYEPMKDGSGGFNCSPVTVTNYSAT
jgi:hypothetical protein